VAVFGVGRQRRTPATGAWSATALPFLALSAIVGPRALLVPSVAALLAAIDVVWQHHDLATDA
jgi:hypothetical protein